MRIANNHSVAWIIKPLIGIMSILSIFGVIIIVVLTGVYRTDALVFVTLFGLLFFHILNLVFGIYIYFDGKRTDLTKKGWLFALLLLPCFGPLIFLWTGFNPFTKKKIIQLEKNIEFVKKLSNYDNQKQIIVKDESFRNILNYCSNVSINKTTTGLIKMIDQSQIYKECVEAIRKAKKYIFVNFYIFRDGIFMRTIINELYLKSLEGVKIFILYDWVGCRKKVDKKFFEKLNGYKNIYCQTFKEKSFFIVNSIDNSRNHKKSLIIDGEFGIIGGFNVADEYINENRDFAHWRDHAFKIYGKVIHDYLKIFLLDWKNYTNANAKPLELIVKNILDNTTNSTKEYNTQIIQTFNSFPEKDVWKIFNLYTFSFSNVKKRIWINTPYFYPTEQMLRILICLVSSGVDVRIILPGKPDDKNFILDINRLKYEKWIKAGIKIYEYNGFTHCKSIIIDDDFSFVGTINLDPRAMNINYENLNIVYDKNLNKQLSNDFLKTIENSTRIKEKIKDKSLISRICGKIILIFLLFFEPLL